MTPDLTRLRQLAESATPGPWHDAKSNNQVLATDPNGMVICKMDGGYMHTGVVRDRAYIAAANPAAILALLDGLEAAESANEQRKHLLKLAAEHATEEMAKTDAAYAANATLADQCDALRRERDEAVAALRRWNEHEPLARHCEDPVILELSRTVVGILAKHPVKP